MYQILLFYKYTHIEDPEKLKEEQEELCQRLNLKGRLIMAKEGFNVTLEGTKQNTEKYIKELNKDPRFKNIHFKRSAGTGQAFPRLSIKVRDEIVSAHLNNDINPTKVTGKYLTSEELHQWFEEGREFYMVDMRNDYEQAIGYFQNSLLAPFKNFRDLPKVLPQLESLKGKTIVTVCTGGVRCEKASGFLVENGFKDVYQLYGGIVSYMERYPNEHFLGKLYVFDGRVTMGFNTQDPNHTVVGSCNFCKDKADTYHDCQNLYCRGKRHFISCDSCIKKSEGYCSTECLNAVNYSELII